MRSVENVSPIMSPDKDAMAGHLTMLFGRALHGRIEITAIHTNAREDHIGTRASFFGLDQMDEAVARAAAYNSEPCWNVYVGAALRREDVFPGKAAEDADFLRTYAIWADADDEDQLQSARQAYAGVLDPPFVVVTGRTPQKRAQLWWPLETPIDDIDVLRATLRGLVARLGTDPKVCTGKQLMRLAGGVSWPKVNKPGRIVERTEIVHVARAAREFALDHVHRACPPQTRAELKTVAPDVQVAPAGSLGLDERIMDGREGYAFGLVRAHLHEYIGVNGALPSPDDLFRQVWPVYSRKVDLARPGRGPDFLARKCGEAIRAFEAGQIPFMRDLDEAVASYHQKLKEGRATDTDPPPFEDATANPVAQNIPENIPDDDPGPFPASALTGEPPARKWLVEDWIVAGAVNSLYGDGGLGKTLLAQQLACSAALGVPWLGLRTTAGPVLACLCEDEKDELHRRHNAIKAAMGYGLGNPFDDVWLWPRVGYDNVLVRWDRDGKAILGPFAERLLAQVRERRPALLILDTLADFYGGNEIDRVQVNYFAKTVLGGLIKEMGREGHVLTVLLLGHPSVAGGAEGGRGYSGSTAWNGAVRARIYLTRPDEGDGDERLLTRGKANYAKSGEETGIRLYFEDGALRAENQATPEEAAMDLLKGEVVEMVAAAWRSKLPFAGSKGHRRYIHTLLPQKMRQFGYPAPSVRKAIRELIDDDVIVLGKSHNVRGFRPADAA